MTSRRHHAEAIDALYAAAVESSRWGDALTLVATAADADAAALLEDDTGRGRVVVFAASGLDAERVAAWEDAGIHLDPLVRATLARAPGTLIRDSEVLAPAELARTAMATLLLDPDGLSHTVGCAIRDADAGWAGTWIFRAADRGPFPQTSIDSIGDLVPHLQRAYEVRGRLEAARRLSTESLSVLDRFAVASFLVDEQGRVVNSNRMATRLLAARDGLEVRDGAIVGTTSDDTRRLRSVISEAARPSPSTPRGRGLRLPRPSGLQDLEVIVVPLADRGSRTRSSTVAILLVVDPEKPPRTSEQLLDDLFGLTGAEARLAIRLMRGDGLTQAADALGVSRNTVQTQLAAIFRKTGTSRQAELVRLLVRGPASIRTIEDSSGFWPAINL